MVVFDPISIIVFWDSSLCLIEGKMMDCECGKNDWVHIPDSLADACKQCGFVRVLGGPGGYTKGKSIQEWAADVYGQKRHANESELEKIIR